MKNKGRLIEIIVILILAVIIVLEVKYYSYEKKAPFKKVQPISDIYRRVLIFAPHPDDETLGAAGIIQSTIKHGGHVKVVIMTNGDSYRRAVEEDYHKLNPKPSDFLRMGQSRLKESINAMEYLGVKKDDIVFLGYPDLGLSELWGNNWEIPFKSIGTKVTRSPYNNSYTKNVVYKGANVVKDLIAIIKEYDPTLVVYPHPNEVHPDHWATSSFVKYTLFTLNKNSLPQYLYIVHRSDWPLPWGKHPELNLNPPVSLLRTNTKWNLYPLTKEQVIKKGNAIMMYKTQIKVIKSFMQAFDRKTELFGHYPDGVLKKFKGRSDLKDYRVIIDPVRDNLRDYENSSADIVDVYAYIKDDNLYVFIRCRGKISTVYNYNFYGIFFKNQKELGRVESHFISGRLQGDGHSLMIKGNMVVMTIPLSKYKGFDHIYIATDSLYKGYLIDKTAWRMLAY